MAKRYFNWTLAIVLVVAAVVLVVSAVALRGWQRKVRAERGLDLGMQAYERGDWQEAASQLGRYVAIYGDDTRILLRYAEAQLNRRPWSQNNINQARSVYSSILRDRGADPALVKEAATALVELDLQLSDFGEAAQNATYYLQNRDDPVVRRLLGVALRERGRWKEAVDTLAGLLRDHPEDVLAYEVIGTLAEDRPSDVNQPAQYWFEQAVQRNPESALAHIIRADFHRRCGEPNAALADLEQAESLDLSDTQARLRLIAALINVRAMDDAKQHLTALQAEVPDQQGLYHLWAALAFTLGSTEEMQTAAREGLASLVKQPWDFMPVATELLLQAGNVGEAEQCIARMRERGVHPQTVAYLEGRVARQRGQLQEAVRSWRRAIAVDYTDYLNKNYRTPPPVRMALASVLDELGDRQAAIGQMRAFVSDAPKSDDPEAIERHINGRAYLAQLLARSEDWAGVMDEVRQIRQLDPDSLAGASAEIQAQIALLVADREPPGTSAWRGLEGRVAALEEATQQSLASGLLRVRLAAGQGDFAQAYDKLDELERRYPDEVQLAQIRASLNMAEADRYAAQDRLELAAEKRQEALALLRRAVETFPQSAEPVLHLSTLLGRQQRIEECESVLIEAMARIELPQGRRELGLRLADWYAIWDRQEKLYELLTQLEQLYPTDIKVKRRLLNLERVGTDLVAAQKLVDEIKAIEGENGRQWRLEQARVWLNPQTRRSRHTEVVAMLKDNLRADPGDIQSRLLLASAYERNGEVELALTAYREALSREPNNVGVITNTVNALISAGRAGEASRVLAEAEQRGLHSPQLRILQLNEELRLSGTAQDSESRREALVSAAGILEEMLTEDPNNVDTRLELALVRARQQKYDEAQAIIDEVKAANPQALDVMVAQLRLYVAQDDAEKALQLCNTAVEDLHNAAAYAMRGLTYATFGRTEEAVNDFSQAIELEPKTAAWRLVRSDFYRTLDRLDDASMDAREALKLVPSSVNAQRRIVALLLDSGKRSDLLEAEKLLNRWLLTPPQDAGLRLLEARLLLRKGTAAATEQARNVLTELTKTQPTLVEAWERLIRLELLAKRTGTALNLATEGLAHNPGDRTLLLLKADAEFERSPAVAIPTLKELANQDPRNVSVIGRLAEAYAESGNPEAGLGLLQDALDGLEGTTKWAGEVVLASIMYRNGDKAGAKALFDRLLETRPEDSRAVLVFARLLVTDGETTGLKELMDRWCSEHPEDTQVPVTIAHELMDAGGDHAGQVAEGLLRDVLQRHPTAIGALTRLAILMQTSGRGAESAQLYRRVLDLDPNNTPAMNNLAWYLCEEQRSYQEALGLANRGLLLAPDYTDLRDTRGVIYYRTGRYEDAVRDLELCVEQYQGTGATLTGARFRLGRAYLALGRKGEAEAQLSQALALHDRVGGLSSSDKEEAERLLTQVRDGS